jgi:uncharacterized repeat protein (TIGR02543 family)
VNATGDITVMAEWRINLETENLPSIECSIAPTRTGYIFSGWYTAPTVGILGCVENGNYDNLSGNVTLYAQWTDSEAPTVTFSPDGSGTYATGHSTIVTVEDDNLDETSLKYLWT